jgi:hypothetical protein
LTVDTVLATEAVEKAKTAAAVTAEVRRIGCVMGASGSRRARELGVVDSQPGGYNRGAREHASCRNLIRRLLSERYCLAVSAGYLRDPQLRIGTESPFRSGELRSAVALDVALA